MEGLLLLVSIAPVVVFLVWIYRSDTDREPLKVVLKTFLCGIGSVPLALILVSIIRAVVPGGGPFYDAFFTAGIPEELAKFLILFMLIWKNKDFDEYFDGIVYAVTVSMAFACVENVMYVFGSDSIMGSMSTGFVRALISIPGHGLFGIAMGFFLAFAKFGLKSLRPLNIALCMAVPMMLHGVFDYLLMKSEWYQANGFSGMSVLITIAFFVFDYFLWKLGLKYIKKHISKSGYKAIRWDV